MVNTKHPTNQELFYFGLFDKAKNLLSSTKKRKENIGCGKINTKPTFFSTMDDSETSEIPTFHQVKEEEQYTDCGLPFSEVIAMFARRATSAYENFLISERGCELLSKASEYEILYDVYNIDFLTLRDQVDEFEEAIEKAAQVGIDWRNFGYDLLAIEQEIIDIEEAESDYMRYARSEFYSTRGVEA